MTLLWFIDNEAAAAAGIRADSKEDEVNTMVQAAHLLWLHLGCRVWIEWIDSGSNPADGLSRDGLSDSWTRAQPWILSESAVPPWSDITAQPDDLFHALGRDIGLERGDPTLG